MKTHALRNPCGISGEPPEARTLGHRVTRILQKGLAGIAKALEA